MTDKNLGLTSVEAADRRLRGGYNTIPQPNSYPDWLCCVAPCLRNTVQKKLFQSYIPESCVVLRNGIWITIDITGLVCGDIVKVMSGDHLAADCYLLKVRCLPSFTFFTS
jgi:hypothetical protein